MMSIGSVARSSISARTLALHAAAAIFALGAAALAGHALQARNSGPDMMLTASAPITATPERIAGLIEPAIRASAAAAAPLLQAVAAPVPHQPPARPALVATAKPAPLPPLPQPRPCIECQTAETTAPAVDPADATAPDPVLMADFAPVGPVPPLPVGAGAGGDVSPAGLVLRGGQAVMDGSLQAVGTAWTASGAAVDDLVRTVRSVSF